MNTKLLLLLYACLFWGLSSPNVCGQVKDNKKHRPLSKKALKGFLKHYNQLPDTLNDGKYYSEEEIVTEQIMLKDGSTRTEVVPAVFDTITAKILIKEAYNGYQQPVYQTIEETVAVAAAYEHISIQRKMGIVEEQELDKPAYIAMIKRKDYHGKITDACYDPVREIDTCFWNLVRSPATYKKVAKQKYIDSISRQMIPTVYKTFRVQRVDKIATQKNPMQTQRIIITAEYQTYQAIKIKAPATVREIEEPVSYSTILTKKTITVGKTPTLNEAGLPNYVPPYANAQPIQPAVKVVPIREGSSGINQKSAQVGGYTRVVLGENPSSVPPSQSASMMYNSPSSFASRKMPSVAPSRSAPPPPEYVELHEKLITAPLTDSKATPSKVAEIQQALLNKGYDTGPIDNVLGAKTRAALLQFQKDNNIPVGNLNLETMRLLGIERDGYGYTGNLNNNLTIESINAIQTPDELEKTRISLGLMFDQQQGSQDDLVLLREALTAKEADLKKAYHNATFVGGETALAAYLQQSLVYPAEAQQNDITGTVVLGFTIDKQGKVTQPHIQKGVSWDINKAALQWVENMPNWEPQVANRDSIEVSKQFALQFAWNDSIDRYETRLADSQRYSTINENEFLSTKDNPISTFSIDVDNAAYSQIRQYLNSNALPSPNMVRTEEMINYFSYDYPQPSKEHPFSITTEMQLCPWNKKHGLLLIGLQGKQIDFSKAPSNNLVFLVDVSGSMSEELPLVVQSLKKLTAQMRPEDKIAIVVYAGAAGEVLPATSGNDKASILAALDRLQAGGSTAGGQGINLAYQIAQQNFLPNGNNRIILVTDGDFNVGVSSTKELQTLVEEKRKGSVFLSCIGIGGNNYRDNMLETLADKGNGNYSYIDTPQEADKIFVHQLTGTLYVIAKDVKLQLEFNPEHIKGYRLIGYENRMLATEDFDNDQKDAGELGANHTVTALYEVIGKDFDTDLPQEPAKKPEKSKIYTQKNNPELLTVKFRYKEPNETQSRLIEKPLQRLDMQKSMSNNFAWASCVAEFALLLRDSQFKGKAKYADLLVRSQKAKGTDTSGYRQECISLMEKASSLSK
jgi:Ca-activated chloride channel family protein